MIQPITKASSSTKDNYGTQDIVLAATLKVLNYNMSYIEKNGNKGTFYFDDVEPSVIADYDLGNLKVEPQAFNAAIKALTTATRRSM